MQNITSQIGNFDSSLIKALLLFYVIIGSSLIQPLLSKQWRNFVEDNRLVQHIIGITTLLALIILFSDNLDNFQILQYITLGYLWFLFSTKLDLHWNIVVTLLLLCLYVNNNKIKQKNTNIVNDKILSNDEKIVLLQKNDKNILYFVFIFIITITGTYMYSNKKEIQYGGGYSLINFLLY